jgi:sarcosine oxidase
MQTCDVAVVGLGVDGCAARACLAARGVRVIAFEQATPGHDGGSSHGESRVTRRSNFENPGYAPLIARAMDLWRDLEAAPGDLYEPAGVLEAGPAGSAYLDQTRLAAAAGGVEMAALTPAEVRGRFPAIRLPAHWQGLFQPDGGYLRADRAIQRYLERAAGSELRLGTRVVSVEQRGETVEVVTAAGETVQAGAAIVTAGAWIGDLVPELAPCLSVTRQTLGWFQPRDPSLFAGGRFPVFLFVTEIGLIYGFPDIDGGGVKMGLHVAGARLGHADAARQDGRPEEVRPARTAVRGLLPDLYDAPLRTKTCLYTTTTDEEFVIDRRPGHPRVVFASACSGHGFKFASAIGEALADLALGQTPNCSLDLFRLSRFRPDG